MLVASLVDIVYHSYWGLTTASRSGEYNPGAETLVGLESQSPVNLPEVEGPVGHGSDLAHGLPPPGKRSSGAVSTGGPASNGFPPPGKRSSSGLSSGFWSLLLSGTVLLLSVF